MTLLIVDDDGHLTELMRTVLAGDVAEVSTVEDLGSALDLVKLELPDLVLVNANVQGASGTQFVRTLRSLRGGDRVRVLMHTAFPDPVLRDECAALGVDRLLVRPFSMLDLAEIVRTPPQSEPAAAPPVMPQHFAPRPQVVAPPRVLPPGGDLTNLGAIVRLWARRANGVLQVDVGGEAAWVMLAAGGPVDEEGMRAIRGSLLGGDIEFQPCDVEGDGRHADLAQLLWQVAWDASRPAEYAVLAIHVLSRKRLSEATDELPLPPAARTLLRYVNRGVALGVLVEEHGLDPEAAARAAQALAYLGMIGLQEAFEPARATVAARGVPPVEAEIELTGGTSRDALMIRRLRREVALLKDADAWLVLGVPKDVPTAVLVRATARMTERYQELARHTNPTVRELGQTLLMRTIWARDALGQQLANPAAGSPSAEEEAFKSGLHAMAVGDWSGADKWFTTAHELNLDSARDLAHLGWARLHNPDQQLHERVEEGVDLLRLAEQLDPDNADGQYFLAVALHRQGDDDGASRRVRRALRNQPDHVAASALARKLRRPPHQA